MRILLGVVLLGATFQVEAVTCTGNDVSYICDLKPVTGGRCASLYYFRLYCDNSTSGCNGKCFGETTSGHWFDMSRLNIDGKAQPRWRCRCGCFAEETVFQSDYDFSGREIIIADDIVRRVSSFDDISLQTTTYRPINSVVYGAGKEKAVEITTLEERRLILSRAHPVVISDTAGRMVAIKKAETLQVDDLLLASDGRSDKVIQIRDIDYHGKMVNFNVQSNDPAHHLLLAADLVMGDLAWQERLSSVESRIMYRNAILQALMEAK